ncbi:GNAT family N-acetyltransferase [Methylocapsa sp. S129]|uniref:GNAT family N-acetyltransferase n=1 Tax=Methylocapsa sp. S129 TaxID=1641869 RepID=UPI00131C8461|nr:N-acetyltransferase [Methylocapsa sp. S129]
MTLLSNAVLSAVAAAPAGLAISRAPEIRISQESPFDAAAREALLDEAFGPARDAKTSARLREGRLPAEGLALVARDHGELVGTLRCWPVQAGGHAALLLGPLAVAKSHRSLGIGAKLMREALWRAAMLGHKAVLLVGDAPYYARFGFEASLTAGLDLPGPVDRARFLAFEIEDGALDGAKGMVIATGERRALRRRAQQALKQAA